MPASIIAYVNQQLFVGTTTLGGRVQYTGNQEERYAHTLTAALNPVVPFEFDGDDAILIWAVASVDMTLTPDGGGPVLTLAAGVPFQWVIDSNITNPFAGITVTQFTVANVLAGDLNIYVLSNV